MPREKDTAESSSNSVGLKTSVGPKTSRAVASFDPNGYIALDASNEMVEVTFREAGVDQNRAGGIRFWASCTEGDTAAPRQLAVTLPPGLYRRTIFTTNVTKDGLDMTEKITERGREVTLQGMLTSYPHDMTEEGTGGRRLTADGSVGELDDATIAHEQSQAEA